MSTAGKVLTVFVTILLLVWIGLAAMVARLNSEWGSKIKGQEESLTKLEKEQQDSRAELAKLKNDLAQEQELLDKDIIVHRSELSDLEARLTSWVENALRLQNQVAGQQVAEKAAETSNQRRLAELEQTKKDLASGKDEVTKLKEETNKLFADLEKLQDEFKATLAENQRLVRRTSGE